MKLLENYNILGLNLCKTLFGTLHSEGIFQVHLSFLGTLTLSLPRYEFEFSLMTSIHFSLLLVLRIWPYTKAVTHS